MLQHLQAKYTEACKSFQDSQITAMLKFKNAEQQGRFQQQA